MPIINAVPSRVLDRRPFTAAMLAERWQCSERHIRNLIAAGDLRAFKVGGKLLRISMDAIEQFEAGSVEESEEKAEMERRRQATNQAAKLARLSANIR